jgi:hypothetical protein
MPGGLENGRTGYVSMGSGLVRIDAVEDATEPKDMDLDDCDPNDMDLEESESKDTS